MRWRGPTSEQGSADLFLRSAAFRCDGLKNHGPTKQVALQVVEQSRRTYNALTSEVPNGRASAIRGARQ